MSTCPAVTHPPGAHVWPSPVSAGDPCRCGRLRIARTIKTGTWRGLSVVSWTTEPVTPAPEQEEPPMATLYTCVRCGLPITDGVMRGMGDGTGQRFGHSACYWRSEAEQAEAEVQRLRAVLMEIAHYDDNALQMAKTLHWDMRGKARRALVPAEGGEG